MRRNIIERTYGTTGTVYYKVYYDVDVYSPSYKHTLLETSRYNGICLLYSSKCWVGARTFSFFQVIICRIDHPHRNTANTVRICYQLQLQLQGKHTTFKQTIFYSKRGHYFTV